MLLTKWASEFTWITTEMQNELFDIQELKDIISWEYMLNKENTNIQEIISHLFPWDDEKWMLMNPGSYIWWIVYDKYKSYVWEPEVDLESDIDLDYPLIIENLLASWKILLRINWWTKKWFKASIQNPTQYYYDWNTEWFIEILKKVEYQEYWINEIVQYFLYVQKFQDWVLENKLYEIEQWILQYWNPVPLSKIPELEQREDIQIEWIERLVIQIDVEHILMKKLRTVIYSIDRKIAEAEKHFNNYTEEFKIFKNINIPDDCYTKKTVWNKEIDVIDWDKLWKVVEASSEMWEWTIEIVKNWNELLEQAILFMEKQIKFVSNISDVPLFFFWVQQETWNDSWTSKIKSSWAFYQRILFYRKQIENAIYYYRKSIKGDSSVVFDWPPIIKLDEWDVLDIEIKKLNNWLTTKTKSLMLLYWVDENEAKKMLEEINVEQDKILATKVELWIK